MMEETDFDWDRKSRMGLAESVFCAGKSRSQILAIAQAIQSKSETCLFTRLDQNIAAEIDSLDYDAVSQTGFLGNPPKTNSTEQVCIVTAGTSDAGVAREAARTLQFAGIEAGLIFDVGVAGLHRLIKRLPEIEKHKIVIVVAGMDAALASVIGGQVNSIVIGVPTSIGYGAARKGETALASMLTSCAAGLTVVNIDNGYGAACAAIRALNQI